MKLLKNEIEKRIKQWKQKDFVTHQKFSWTINMYPKDFVAHEKPSFPSPIYLIYGRL